MINEATPTLAHQQDPALLDPSNGEATIALRNQAIEAVLDPEGTLPEVTLVDSYERSPRMNPNGGYDSHNYAVYDEDSTHIARISVSTPFGTRAEKRGIATVKFVEIKPDKQKEYKGRGYGRAMYVEVLKALPQGIELECDGSVRPDAYKIWQWLESKGLAERPAELGDPVLDARGAYQDLGYKTQLAKLTDFAAAL